MAKSSFLDRNKKKSLLALLLLFLRERKILVVLLLLVLLASSVFITPSSLLTGWPGGPRVAAGVAWIAGKMGMDVSRWGLGTEKRSYRDLLAAFEAARLGSGGPGGKGVGWGPFFARPAGPVGDVPNSLDMVKGSKADLTAGGGAGGGAVAGVLNPQEAQNVAVAVTPADLGGEREGATETAFAGGFMSGVTGASRGDEALSGGAFATKDFFAGLGGPAGAGPGDYGRGGLSTLHPLAVPSGKIHGAAKGSLSSMATNQLNLRGQKGITGVTSPNSGTAFGNLVQANGEGLLSTQYCVAPDCPPEYADTNDGAVFDGNYITAGFLTGTDPAAIGAGLIAPTVNVPPINQAGGIDQNAAEIATCENDAMQCEQQQENLANGFPPPENQIQALAPQLPGACIQVCSCGNCNSLNSAINAQCSIINGISSQINSLSCNMPSDCASLGVPTPTNMQNVGSFCPQMGCVQCLIILGICLCGL